MNFLQSFKEYVERERLFSSKDKLLLAVSGGMDSVVLCELCHQSGFEFIIAHANFQLRDQESERDEKFVRELGQKYGREVVVKRFETETYASENKVSIQVAARELRYRWFYSLVDSSQLTFDRKDLKDQKAPNCQPSAVFGHPSSVNYILTAHQQDDNIETVLMNFFKGTGIAGLRGMLSKQGRIVRPLLFAGKEELKQFASAENLTWVEDSSNKSDKYTRNYFRHQVIPLVQKIFPAAIGNLANNIERFRDIEIIYRQAVDQSKKKLIEARGAELHIPVLKLKRAGALPTMIYEIIKDFNFTAPQVKEAIDLLDSESGKYIQSSTHRMIKNRGWVIIAPNDSTKAETILIGENMGLVECSGCKVQFSRSGTGDDRKIAGTADPVIAMLDADKIRYPLILRRWRPGDYFYPLGMRKKKKIARFLIDNKVSKTEKERVWVLEMDKKIIWLMGLRIDDRFKIESSTTNILKIEMRMT